ncbi:hypothetical protein [Gracilibacillus dipsosauri]
MDESKRKMEFFKQLRDISNAIVEAYENEDEKELESAMGKFIFLMM